MAQRGQNGGRSSAWYLAHQRGSAHQQTLRKCRPVDALLSIDGWVDRVLPPKDNSIRSNFCCKERTLVTVAATTLEAREMGEGSQESRGESGESRGDGRVGTVEGRQESRGETEKSGQSRGDRKVEGRLESQGSRGDGKVGTVEGRLESRDSRGETGEAIGEGQD
jgi:hypothetical protein